MILLGRLVTLINDIVTILGNIVARSMSYPLKGLGYRFLINS